MIESLEPRRLLAANFSATLSGGVLTVTGTHYSDTVTFESTLNGLRVRADVTPRPGELAPLPLSPSMDRVFAGEISHIVVDAGDGHDYVSVGKRRIPALLAGGNGNDTLVGGWGNDTLDGGNGDDRLYGGRGDDTLLGRNGRDRLYGGTGTNLVSGGSGFDRRVADGGFDRFVYKADLATDIERIGETTYSAVVGIGATSPRFDLRRLGGAWALSTEFSWSDTSLQMDWGTPRREGENIIVELTPRRWTAGAHQAVTPHRFIHDINPTLADITPAKFVVVSTQEDGVLYRGRLK